jgi:hypothetical protein
VTGFWDLVKRRPKLPAGADVPLDADERVIAWARTPDDGFVVVTNRGLHLPARPARLGWHEIHKAVWSGRELTVTPAEVVADRNGFLEVADRPVERVLLLDAGTVPEQIRSRVTGSVSYTAHHQLHGGGVRVVARKVSGVDGLSWTVRYDPGTPVTPAVLEETAALVAGIRSTADAQP